ncbi:hypothetical protein DPMN_112018 [Dreissena polymorpha]|uniref:Uncharacterized protein n=1 Tax=Dreissena polymorpha TaxID=45954 RepID=A0A9D4KFQ5_DREPO|nr:hypothetical protein DPMN_112018 [Dreissena polymorpha]
MEEGVIIEVANKLMQDIHERARRPMTPEMNERRTLSETRFARQILASSDSEERFHTAPEDRIEVSLSDPPVFGPSTSTCSSSSKSSGERTPLRRKRRNKKAKRVRTTRQEEQQISQEIRLSDARELPTSEVHCTFDVTEEADPLALTNAEEAAPSATMAPIREP